MDMYDIKGFPQFSACEFTNFATSVGIDKTRKIDLSWIFISYFYFLAYLSSSRTNITAYIEIMQNDASVNAKASPITHINTFRTAAIGNAHHLDGEL